ncbi:MAG: hypothetical protein JKY37_19230 [Nannocystaceae bacterium]|nr:hypothetical protein [Nannocystaceae bacterium]
MPSVLTTASQVTCMHGGVTTHVPSNVRVKALGSEVLVATDQNAVAACGFAPGGASSPCVTVQWTVPSARVKVLGQPVLLQNSVGLGSNAAQAPQGLAIVIVSQPRVQGL